MLRDKEVNGFEISCCCEVFQKEISELAVINFLSISILSVSAAASRAVNALSEYLNESPLHSDQNLEMEKISPVVPIHSLLEVPSVKC